MIEDPNKGTEILYIEGENNGKAIVNPGKFLPTLKLSPYNSLLTKEQHHTILSSGFSIVGKIVESGVKRADDRGKFDEVFNTLLKKYREKLAECKTKSKNKAKPKRYSWDPLLINMAKNYYLSYLI